MDDNQYSYLKDKMERERLSRQRLIRPLEEVMEEDQSAKAMEEMEVEDTKASQQTTNLPQKPSYITPYLGIGPSGGGEQPGEQSGEQSGGQSGEQSGGPSLSPVVMADSRMLAAALSQQPGSLKTGIGFHSAMLAHQCHCDNTRNHPERPERLV